MDYMNTQNGYLAQRAAAQAAAKAARQKWMQQQGRRKKNPANPANPTATNSPATIPPGSPTTDPTTTSTSVPGLTAYYENMANAERAWREAQAEINRSRSRLATDAGYTFKDGQYELDPLGAGTFQQTTNQFGDTINQLRDSAASRGMVSGQQEAVARGGYGDAMRRFQQTFAQNEGDLAAADLQARSSFEMGNAEALSTLVRDASNKRNFDPAAVPDEVTPAPTAAELPTSGSPTPKMKYWGVEFLPWQWDIFVKKAHARGQDPNQILLSHPGLRKFFTRK